MFPQLSGTTADYALGIANNTLWSSVPTNATQFQWFGGTGSAMILSGAGALSTTTPSGASRNTMDDGNGNMTISGTSVIGGSQLWVSTNTNTVASGTEFLNITAFPSGGNGHGYNTIVSETSAVSFNPTVFPINSFNGTNGSVIITSGSNATTTGAGSVYARATTANSYLYVDGVLSTTHTTVDDGNGNMIVSGQINATGGLSVGGNSTAFGNFAVNLGGSSSVNAYIQATTGSGAVSRLNINPVGGSVHTQNTILDDGSGNMTVGSLYATGSGSAPPSGVYAHIGVATLSNPGTTGGFLTAQNGGTFLPIQIGGAAYTPHTTVDDGSGNLTMQSGTTLQSGSVTKLGFTSNSNNAGQLVFTSNGATGSPFCSTLINSIGGPTIFQAPMVFQWSQNGSSQHFQSNFIITPNPTSNIPFSASSLTGVGGFSFYNDANMGVNGTLFLGNSANSATTFPVFQTIQANGAGTSIAFSGGLTTALNTLDDGSGRMSLSNQLSVQPGVTGSAVSLTTTSGNNMTFQVSTNQQLQFVGQGTTGCFLQSTGNTATNAQTLWLNATGGALRSRLNVLDDSSGNMTVNGTFALSGAGTASSALATYLQPTLSTGNLNDIQLGVSLAPNNTGVLAFNYVGSGSTSNSVGLSMRGMSTSLSVNGAGKVTTPAGSILDDGSGNMTITGTSQTPLSILNASMATNTFSTVFLGQLNSTNNAAFIQYGNPGGVGSSTNFIRLGVIGNQALTITGGNKITTQAGSNLDDGSGNMSVVGNLTLSNANNTLTVPFPTNSSFNGIQVGSASDINGRRAGLIVGTPLSGVVDAFNVITGGGASGTTALRVSNTGLVSTLHTTVDDGSGNMSVGGKVTSNGLQVNNTNTVTLNYTGTSSNFAGYVSQAPNLATNNFQTGLRVSCGAGGVANDGTVFMFYNAAGDTTNNFLGLTCNSDTSGVFKVFPTGNVSVANNLTVNNNIITNGTGQNLTLPVPPTPNGNNLSYNSICVASFTSVTGGVLSMTGVATSTGFSIGGTNNTVITLPGTANTTLFSVQVTVQGTVNAGATATFSFSGGSTNVTVIGATPYSVFNIAGSSQSMFFTINAVVQLSSTTPGSLSLVLSNMSSPTGTVVVRLLAT
jgi:hypothetical protein